MLTIYDEFKEDIENTYNTVGLLADKYLQKRPYDSESVKCLGSALMSILEFADELKTICSEEQ